jgi:hypothetical protein
VKNPKSKNNKKHKSYAKTIFILLSFTALIWAVWYHQKVNKAAYINHNGSITANTGCNPLLTSSCKDISNTQGVPINNWAQSQSNTVSNPDVHTQISSCAFDAANPPRSSLPPGEISPAELALQKKARTFSSEGAFNNYIQSLNSNDKARAICILDGWTVTQFYNDAISRR